MSHYAESEQVYVKKFYKSKIWISLSPKYSNNFYKANLILPN